MLRNKAMFVAMMAAANSGAAAAVPWYLAGGVPLANCVAAHKPFGAVDIAASYINLANPGTYNAAPGASGPTHNPANGWIFGNTGTAILSTGVTVAAQTWSVLIKFYANGAGASSLGRMFSGNTDGLITQAVNGANHLYRSAGASLTPGANLTGLHTMAICGNKAYLDGADDGTITLGTLLTGEMYIGNRISDVARQCFADIHAFAIYNITLSDTQAAAWHAATNF